VPSRERKKKRKWNEIIEELKKQIKWKVKSLKEKLKKWKIINEKSANKQGTKDVYPLDEEEEIQYWNVDFELLYMNAKF
jgi:hypothetical protein